jgi:OOP family OmpA-OmpF porin
MKYLTHPGTALAAAIFIALHTPSASAETDVPAAGMHVFEQSLASDYQALSAAEAAQGDKRDAATYAARAAAAGAGQATAPDEIELRRGFLKDRYVQELSTARGRLLDALAKTARNDAPAATARAQSSFDCWLEQASEDLQPTDIEACKQSFMTAMNTVEASPQPVADVPAPIPTPTPAPAPAYVAKVNDTYRVFFDFDSAELDAAAMAVLERVKTDISSGEPYRLNVSGHTSSIGAADYNMRLSQRRADAVKAALEGMQLNVESIKTEARGEGGQLVPTDDGVREPQNRNAYITILP